MKDKAHATFTLATDVRDKLEKCANYGYANKSVMVEAAIRRLCNEPEAPPMSRAQIEAFCLEVLQDWVRKEEPMMELRLRGSIQSNVFESLSSSWPNYFGEPDADEALQNEMEAGLDQEDFTPEATPKNPAWYVG